MKHRTWKKIPPHRRIVELIRVLPAVDVQNRLMRIRDSDLALSMIYMADGERARVLSLAGTAKSSRVREELARLEHTRITYAQYESTAEIVIRSLESERGAQAHERERRSYYRPTRS